MKSIRPKAAVATVASGAALASLGVGAWAAASARHHATENVSDTRKSESTPAASAPVVSSDMTSAAASTKKPAADESKTGSGHADKRVGRLAPGTTLRPGQGVRSRNGRYLLLQQKDGNLVLYKGSKALWSTRTAPHPGGFTVMQGDGNLVVYGKDEKPLWHAGTAPHPGAFLAVQDDGNLVVYSKSKKVLWWRDIFNEELPPGYVLKAGQAVLSHNRRYYLIEQNDGNLVLYRGSLNGPSKALWSMPVKGPNPGAFAIMQTDGDLVVYSRAEKPLWGAGTAPNKGAYLMVQDDGNVIVYSRARKPLWSSGTAGK